MCVGVVSWVGVDVKSHRQEQEERKALALVTSIPSTSTIFPVLQTAMAKRNWDGRERREIDKQLSYLAMDVRWFVTVFALQGPWIPLSPPSLCCGYSEPPQVL